MTTNRRDFLRDIGLGLSAMVFAPKIIKPTFRDTLRFNRPVVKLIPNPAWFEAPYEMQVFNANSTWQAQLIRRVEWIPDHVKSIDGMTPIEFHEILKKQCSFITYEPIPTRLGWDKIHIPPYIKT